MALADVIADSMSPPLLSVVGPDAGEVVGLQL
jgi:hypothetical protein